MTSTAARKLALPAVILLALFAFGRIGAGIWAMHSLDLTFKSALLSYAATAIAYAVLAYGVFKLSRVAALAAMALVAWQVLSLPQALSRGAVLLVILAAILSTGVVASFKYRSNGGQPSDDAVVQISERNDLCRKCLEFEYVGV